MVFHRTTQNPVTLSKPILSKKIKLSGMVSVLLISLLFWRYLDSLRPKNWNNKIDENHVIILPTFNKSHTSFSSIMLFQPFWPQTDPSTQKSYTTDWTYLRFFKLKLSGYPQFRKYQNKLFKCSQFKKY